MTEEDKKAMDDNNIKTYPSLAFFHPNPKGTGSAIKFSLHPATVEHNGYILVRFAKQITIGDMRGASPVYSKFDWENHIELSLDVDEVSKILEVLRGSKDALGNEGFGIVTNRMRLNIINDVTLDYYKLTIENEDGMFRICLESYEAVGLQCALEGAITQMAFGK